MKYSIPGWVNVQIRKSVWFVHKLDIHFVFSFVLNFFRRNDTKWPRYRPPLIPVPDWPCWTLWYFVVPGLCFPIDCGYFSFPIRTTMSWPMINFGVWVVLVPIFELFCEVFIRPDGYQGLLISDESFTPTTVRYIDTIHFVVELFPFSIYDAVLYGVFIPIDGMTWQDTIKRFE